MGPRLSRRGNRKGGLKSRKPKSFNGATSFSTWKRDVSQPGLYYLVGEASMGPRLSRRGNKVREEVNADTGDRALQWGHVFLDVETL